MREVCKAERDRARRMFGQGAISGAIWQNLPSIAENAPAFERKHAEDLVFAPAVWAYLAQIEEVKTVNPDRALELADRASYLVPRMRARVAYRLRIAAHCCLASGGALRTVGEYDAARGQYVAAYRFLRSGPFGPIDFIDLDIRQTFLWVDLREFDRAWSYAARARGVAEHAPIAERQLWIPRTLVTAGYTASTEENADLAARHFRSAEQKLNTNDHAYFLVASYGLAFALDSTGSGTAEEIVRLTRQASEVAENGTVNAAHLQWVEARALRNKGIYDQAESAYISARETFVGLSIAYYASGACLDLAGMFLENGQHQKAESLMAEILRVMELYSNVEARKALRLYVDAAARKELSRGIVESVRGTLDAIRSA